jgi:8-hydroxy-5-deazaflavin:NADPH oxidoreductase
MKIAFIGYGNMTASLASRWVAKHQIFISGRDIAKAQKLAETLGHGTQHGSVKDGAAFGEVVVLATPHDAVFSAIDAAGGAAAFAEKTVLDINNPVTPDDFLAKTFEGKSLSEAIAAHIPSAHVVKAFNMCEAKVWQMDSPVFDGRKLVTLYCGDNAEAKSRIATLITEIGCEAVDLGELKYARSLEPAAAIVIKFLFAGHDSRTVLNLIQPEAKPIA